MKKHYKIFMALAGILAIAVLYSFAGPVGASAKFAKETGKKCAFCHDGSPKDKKLTKEGECFKKNGNKQGDCW